MAHPGPIAKDITRRPASPGCSSAITATGAAFPNTTSFSCTRPRQGSPARSWARQKGNLFHEHVLVKEPGTRGDDPVAPRPAVLDARRHRSRAACGCRSIRCRGDLGEIRRRLAPLGCLVHAETLCRRQRHPTKGSCPGPGYRRRAQTKLHAARLGPRARRRHPLPRADVARRARQRQPTAAAPSPPASPATTPATCYARATCRRRRLPMRRRRAPRWTATCFRWCGASAESRRYGDFTSSKMVPALLGSKLSAVVP